MKATDWGSFPRNALQKWCFSNYRTAQGACAGAKSTHLSGISMLQRISKKGVAFPQIRAHSDFTAIRCRQFLVSVLATEVGEVFNPRAIGGLL